MKTFVSRLLTALVVTASLTGAVKADDRYYVMLFAAQTDPNVPQHSHTFALFAKASGEADAKIETTTISWMPASLEIEPLQRDPVKGKNLSIAETIQWAQSVRARVSMWGPYPIKKDLYDMAAARAEALNSGKYQYIMLDGKAQETGGVNCIHAVSGMDKSQPGLNTGVARGDEATKMVVSYFEPYILKWKSSKRWLVDRLGIDPRVVRFINPDLTRPE
jgi:hypothetical protein